MQPADFHYDLPPELIAQTPLPERSASRLLHVTPDAIQDLAFAQLIELLHPGDLLVVNDTRVIPARLFGHKATGGRIEMLLERLLTPRRALVQLRASHPPAAGMRLAFDDVSATVAGREQEFFVLDFDVDLQPLLERKGHVPLPPYIERTDTPADRERYQTVFARAPGAVAAPTAGLHFDGAFLQRLRENGVRIGAITLHVGAGTFQPVREHQLTTRRLHAERMTMPGETCAAIGETRRRGGRVIAVGTTVVRALETAARSGEVTAFQGETDLFIMPGYVFRAVDAMLTNFHLPQSSLLMLVCAFGGIDTVLQAYRHAVRQRYRFYSYGDAMFIERSRASRRSYR
jgi:S-adenosylmethionine:tRNA ribosyltransferase-isomerase